MRRLIIYLLIAALTFLAGLTSYRLGLAPRVQVNMYEPLPVSLCELERQPGRYDGRLVRVKAVLYSDVGGPYIYDWSCGSQNIAYPLIDVTGFDGLNPELREWVRNIGKIDAKGEDLESDVVIVGVFDRSYSTSGDFSHRYRIIPKSIEQLTPLHKR